MRLVVIDVRGERCKRGGILLAWMQKRAMRSEGSAGRSRRKTAGRQTAVPQRGDWGMQRILAVVVMAGSIGILSGCGESAADKAAREAKEAAENQAVMKASQEEQQKVKEINEKARAEAAAKGDETSDEGTKSDDDSTNKSDDDSEKSKDE